jgi:hypothetical protein
MAQNPRNWCNKTEIQRSVDVDSVHLYIQLCRSLLAVLSFSHAAIGDKNLGFNRIIEKDCFQIKGCHLFRETYNMNKGVVTTRVEHRREQTEVTVLDTACSMWIYSIGEPNTHKHE